MVSLLPRLVRIQDRASHYIARRYASTTRVIEPDPKAPREAPTPLLFVSAAKWDPHSAHDIEEVASSLSKDGFSSIHCDLDIPAVPFDDSRSLMKYFESELLGCVSHAQGLAPFPPIVLARSTAALIAQTYISSHHASGLFLISPPPSNDGLVGHLLPTPLNEFNFEMKFPMAVLGTMDEIKAIQQRRSLDDTGYVSTYVVPKTDEAAILANVRAWLDDLGV